MEMKRHRTVIYSRKRNGRTYRVIDTGSGTRALRLLVAGGAIQSALFLNPKAKNRLAFPYMKGFEWAFRLNPGIKDGLLLGGGGFSYPRYYLARHPGASICVAEPDPEVLQIAERYFGLKELKARYRERLSVSCTDGHALLASSGKCYDLIINDAFSGRFADETLMSDEGIALIAEHLKPDGLYILNLATALRGPLAHKGQKALRSLRRHFEYTLLLPVHEGKPVWEPQNCLLFASSKEFRYFA